MQVYRVGKIAKLRSVNHDGHIDRINDEIVLYEMNDTPQGTESLEEHSNENRPSQKLVNQIGQYIVISLYLIQQRK